ncbi:MAG: hypothetical protein ABWX84_09910 [Nocardioides sp.]
MEPIESVAEARPDPSGDPGPGSRRQGALAAVGALVVAAFLVAITLPSGPDVPESDREPDRPTTSPNPPPPSNYVRQSSAALIANPQTRLRDVAVTEDGAVAAVWESPDGEDQALAVDRPDGSTYVTDPGQRLVSVTTAPGGLLTLREYYSKVGVLRTSGAVDPVALTDVPVDPEPGDVVVDVGDGPRIFRPDDATVYGLPASRRAGARAGYITPGGTLVLTTRRGPVVGNDDTVVEVRTAPDVGDPEQVVGLRVSHDAGEHWRTVPARALGSVSVDSVAVAGEGTVLLADASGNLTAVPREGRPTRLADAPQLAALQTVGARVWGVARYGGRGPLWWTEDAGATWHRVDVPGLP